EHRPYPQRRLRTRRRRGFEPVTCSVSVSAGLDELPGPIAVGPDQSVGRCRRVRSGWGAPSRSSLNSSPLEIGPAMFGAWLAGGAGWPRSAGSGSVGAESQSDRGAVLAGRIGEPCWACPVRGSPPGVSRTGTGRRTATVARDLMVSTHNDDVTRRML